MAAKRFRFEWILAILVLAGGGLGLSLMLGDPVYWIQERLPGSNYRAYDALIEKTAKKHGVDPGLVKALIWQESRFRENASGAAGERGLMQVTEIAAADWVGAQKIETFVPTDLFDPMVNLEVGTWYLARALRRHADKDDPVPFALAEYNAGASRVNRWGGKPGETELPLLASEFKSQIDFPTTLFYIESIEARAKYYRNRGEFSREIRPAGGG